MVINDRIKQLIQVLDENPNSFAERIGVKGAVVYNIIRGRRNKPSYHVLHKILFSFEEVNTEWLFRGEGEILDYSKKTKAGKSRKSKSKVAKNLKVSIERRALDLIGNIDAAAPQVMPEVEELSELFIHLVKENEEQKLKILDLYEKNEKISGILRQKMGVNI